MEGASPGCVVGGTFSAARGRFFSHFIDLGGVWWVKVGPQGEIWRFSPKIQMSNDATKPTHFFGSERYALDGKGRVTVPFDWRLKTPKKKPKDGIEADEPEEEIEDIFYLVPSTKGECLRAMREDRYAFFGEEAKSLPEMTPERHRMFMRNFYSQCAKTVADKQGRITIPQTYCERYNLKGNVRLNGAGDFFEIWNEAAQAAQQDLDTPDFNKFAGALGL